MKRLTTLVVSYSKQIVFAVTLMSVAAVSVRSIAPHDSLPSQGTAMRVETRNFKQAGMTTSSATTPVVIIAAAVAEALSAELIAAETLALTYELLYELNEELTGISQS